MTRVFAFDFDGVISESLLEAYLITWRISGQFRPELAPPCEPPDTGTIHSFRDTHRSHWEAFSAIVPFGNRCEDYLVIQAAVREGRGIRSQREFNEYRQNFREYLQPFHEEFYRERYEMAERDNKRWLALNAPYPGVVEALRELSGRFELAVATSKDGRSVDCLLDAYGVYGLFRPGTVLDKSMGESKRAHLSRLREFFGCGFERIFFIDDKVNHLIDCHGLGVRCFLAGWGYNGEEEHREAGKNGFPVISPEELKELER